MVVPHIAHANPAEHIRVAAAATVTAMQRTEDDEDGASHRGQNLHAEVVELELHRPIQASAPLRLLDGNIQTGINPTKVLACVESGRRAELDVVSIHHGEPTAYLGGSQEATHGHHPVDKKAAHESLIVAQSVEGHAHLRRHALIPRQVLGRNGGRHMLCMQPPCDCVLLGNASPSERETRLQQEEVSYLVDLIDRLLILQVTAAAGGGAVAAGKVAPPLRRASRNACEGSCSATEGGQDLKTATAHT
mmetsp:Transcript_111688/g.238578  ORF Transcript_111688/g.238578 Transcript_111688/m.238578 type:complete len:248 (+) Transcript_111688:1337-2080(+)